MAGKLHRRSARCHSGMPQWRSFQWRNRPVRTAAARSSSCVPSCTAPALKSPRLPAFAIRCVIVRRFDSWILVTRVYKGYIAARKLAALYQCNSFNFFNQRVRALALPLQTSLAPCPDKPFDEEQKKNKDRDKRSDRQTGECDRKWHEKHGLNVEDQKHYRIQIILCVELNLCVADRFDAAFVGRSLIRTGLWWLAKSPPQPSQRQRNQRKHQRHANENDDE